MFRQNSTTAEFVVDNKPFMHAVSSAVDYPSFPETRFGVSLHKGQEFIRAYKALKVKGFNVCHKYPLNWSSASVHAESFLWNVIDYKVI